MRMDLQTQYFQDVVNTDITFQMLKERSRTTGRGLFPRFARPEASSAPNSAGPFEVVTELWSGDAEERRARLVKSPVKIRVVSVMTDYL